VEVIVTSLLIVFAVLHLLETGSLVYVIYTEKPPQSAHVTPVTVVVCAHNDQQHLKGLIPLLLNQAYENFEVIIALDRCTDGSQQLAETFSDDCIRFIVIKDEKPGIHPKKRAIEQAIRQAQNEWIVLTDADCRPGTKWLKSMARYMDTTTGVVLGQSPYMRQSGLLNQIIQYETFMTALHFTGAALQGRPYMGLGRNLAYRKSLFYAVGGFGEYAGQTGGDDDLLVQRLSRHCKVSVALEPDSWVNSFPVDNWKDYVRQKTRHFSVAKKYTSGSLNQETIRWSIHIILWILLFTLMACNVTWMAGILMVLICVKIIWFNIVSDRITKRFNQLWLPFVDLFYVVFFPLISIRSFWVKKITWN